MTRQSYFSCLRPVHIPFVTRVHERTISQYAPITVDDPFGFRIITMPARERGAPRVLAKSAATPWHRRSARLRTTPQESTSAGQLQIPRSAEKRTSIYTVRVKDET